MVMLNFRIVPIAVTHESSPKLIAFELWLATEMDLTRKQVIQCLASLMLA
jgi:hypothetical protein